MNDIEFLATEMITALQTSVTMNIDPEDSDWVAQTGSLQVPVAVGENFHYQHWICEFEVHSRSEQEIFDVLCETLGAPTQTRRRLDRDGNLLGAVVQIWDNVRQLGVLVILFEKTIQLCPNRTRRLNSVPNDLR